MALTGMLALVALLAGVLAPGDPFAPAGTPLAPPSLAHPMGTDDLGRDVLGAIVHGTRTSFMVVAVATLLAGALGVGIGLVAGLDGGWIDDALMRLTELVQVVPRFFLAVLVIALVGPGLDRLVLLLGLSSWPWTARVVCAETRSLASREFVQAARALGASTPRVLLRHVLPAALPPTAVVVSSNAGTVLLLEAALAFLGLGDPRHMSLGYLAQNAQPFLRVAWWMAVFPGAAIALAVVGLNLLGDTVADASAPRRAWTAPPGG
jgi:peptide/nickel transport system permease protein